MFSRLHLVLFAIPALLVAGCASTPEGSAPDDGLLASTSLLERNRPETGEVVEVSARAFPRWPPA